MIQPNTFTSVNNLDFLAKLCNQFSFPTSVKTTKEHDYRVPNILHFLWISSEIPEKYLKNVILFARMNPRYHVILWVDQNTVLDENSRESNVSIRTIYELDLPLLSKMSKLASRVDYIRYEIMLKFGGIYSDIDSVPIRAFDDLLEQSFVSYGESNIQNSFFGFSKDSPFISMLLSVVSHFANMSDSERNDTFHAKYTGGDLMGACLWISQDNGIRCVSERLTGHAPRWTPILIGAYSRHLYDWNWKHSTDPRGID